MNIFPTVLECFIIRARFTCKQFYLKRSIYDAISSKNQQKFNLARIKMYSIMYITIMYIMYIMYICIYIMYITSSIL